MIPFLKKNKDGKKPPKSTVPRTAQESIPFQRMFEDGTYRAGHRGLGRLFAVLILFQKRNHGRHLPS